MSFAFNTVILFLIIFSGLAARRSYFSKEFSKNYVKKNTFDELVGAIFVGVTLQVCGILILKHFDVFFDFKSIGFILIGAKDDINIANSFIKLENNIGKVALYNLSLVCFGALLGFILRVFIRKLKLDRKWRFFRFDNEWHYILSGEILEFPTTTINHQKINARDFGNKYINILAKVDDHFIIYSGILVEVFLSNDGGLDLLCLNGAKKKVIKKDMQNPSTYEHPMAIDLLVIPYNQILNLSVTYYTLQKVEKSIIPKKPFFKNIWLQAKSKISF